MVNADDCHVAIVDLERIANPFFKFLSNLPTDHNVECSAIRLVQKPADIRAIGQHRVSIDTFFQRNPTGNVDAE